LILSYYKKKKQIINKCRRDKSLRLTKFVAIRVAAALMILITLSCVLIGCVSEWREAIFNAIVEWYDDCFALRYEGPDSGEGETRNPETTDAETDTEKIKIPEYIEKVRKPRDLPEGVWEDVITNSLTTINIDYYNGEEYLFSFSQFILKPTDKYLDNEDGEIRSIKINGCDATVVEYTNKNEIYVFWSDGEYSYHISSTECDVETLIQYAESVN